MNAVADLMHDLDVAKDQDPYGLFARMSALGLKFKDIAERLDIAPNTVTRAIRSTENSDARPMIDALLTRLEAERDAGPAPFPARSLDLLVPPGMRQHDVRLEYSSDGKVQRLVALLVDSALTSEELEQAIREWRKGHDTGQ